MGGGDIAPHSVEEAAASLRASRVSKLDGTRLQLGDARCLVLAAGYHPHDVLHVRDVVPSTEKRCVATRLKHTTTVEELKLWKNGIGPEGIKSMAGVISSLPKLKMLNFYRNRLGDSGTDILVNSLAAGRCQLRSLWLGDNKIETFPEALLHLSSLQKLHLNENRLETVPAALSRMPCLTLVDLDNNPLVAIPGDMYMRGLTRMPGPRWELLAKFLSSQLDDGAQDEAEERASSAQRTRLVRNEAAAAGVE